MTGETSKGEQWVTVVLDGREHVVSCWADNARRTTSPSPPVKP